MREGGVVHIISFEILHYLNKLLQHDGKEVEWSNDFPVQAALVQSLATQVFKIHQHASLLFRLNPH